VTPIFEHRVEVRFRDCDSLGHVNHAVYFTYFEQTRFALWKAYGLAGIGTDAPAAPGVILARAECDYRAPARFGDLLEVRLALAAIGRTSFSYEYEIVSVPDERPIASGKTVQVMYDYAAGKPVEVPADLRSRLSQAPDGRR
jgi:acyl-CoA thioester hydrolase